MFLNNISINLEYYNKFPIILKNALISGTVKFSKSLKKEYNDLPAYRAVKYNNTKKEIDKSDFLSYMELPKNPLIIIDENNISSYSCSLFLNLDELHKITKFPTKNKAIAKGMVKKEFGPIDINNNTSHIDLFLYEDVDPSNEFEVIEVCKKNG